MVNITSDHAVRTEQLHVCRAQWRRCIWMRTCCSTSPRLRLEIRSWASLPPLLPSSSSLFPFPSLLFSVYPLIFYPFCSSPHPFTFSSDKLLFYFFLHVVGCTASAPSASLSSLIAFRSSLSFCLDPSLSCLCVSDSLSCSYLWSDYEPYHGIIESHGRY